MARANFRPDALPRRLVSLCATGVAVAALATLGALALPDAQAHEIHTPASAPRAPVPHAHPAWAELSPAHQQILAPLRPLWDAMPELNRRKWQRIADRYPSLKPEEQARLQERMAEWVSMTPQERRVARENYQITRTLPPEKKAEAWDRYQQLPEEQKKKLAAAEKVPRRPGAVSGLPSGKRLPTDTRAQIRASKEPGAPGSLSSALPASAAVAAPASAPAAQGPTQAATSMPAAAPEAAASAPAALSPPVTGEAATEMPVNAPDAPRQ